MGRRIFISGYWKDNKQEFNGYEVRETDDVCLSFGDFCLVEGINQDDRLASSKYDIYLEEIDDDGIFYYGITEEDIIEAIELVEDTIHEFVITSYEVEEN